MIKTFTNLARFCFVILIIPFQTFGQKNFQKGYVVLPSNDTIAGLIDNQEWAKNPKVISFKENEQSSIISYYKPRQLKSFYLSSGEHYISELVTIDKTSVTLNDLIKSSDPIIEKDTVFLGVLVNGLAGLFYLMDENGKIHFFLQKAGEPINELLQRRSIIKDANGAENLVTSDIYKGQLLHYLGDYPLLAPRIKKIRFRQSELMNIVQEYNNLKTGKSGEVSNRTEGGSVSLGLLGGVSRTKLSFAGQFHKNLTNSEFKQTYNFVAGAYLNLILLRNRKKWSLYNELIWKPYTAAANYENIKSKDHYEKGVYNFKLGYLGLANMVRFTWPLSTIKPFINVGIANNFALNSSISLIKTVHFYGPDEQTTHPGLDSYRKYEQALVGGAGITSGRITAEARLEKGNGMSRMVALQAAKNMIMFILSYKIN